MKVTRKFIFSAAHHLTDYYGKCEQTHGHTYELLVTVEGPIQENGMVVDFSLLKKVVEDEALVHLDHRDLNDIFENPTAENITLFVWKKLKPIGRLLLEKMKNPEFLKHIEKAYLLKNGKRRLPNYSRVKLKEVKLFEGPNTYVTLNG